MKCKLTPGSSMLIQDVEYTAGDVVDLDKDFAEVQIGAGIVEEVKSNKEK